MVESTWLDSTDTDIKISFIAKHLGYDFIKPETHQFRFRFFNSQLITFIIPHAMLSP